MILKFPLIPYTVVIRVRLQTNNIQTELSFNAQAFAWNQRTRTCGIASQKSGISGWWLVPFRCCLSLLSVSFASDTSPSICVSCALPLSRAGTVAVVVLHPSSTSPPPQPPALSIVACSCSSLIFFRCVRWSLQNEANTKMTFAFSVANLSCACKTLW